MPQEVKTKNGKNNRSSNNIDELLPRDKWIQQIDVIQVENDFNALRHELERQQGPEDVEHLNKILWWSRILNVLGLCFMVLSPSYIFPAFFSIYGDIYPMGLY